MTRTTTNLKRAVLELGINVPIYRTESGPNGIITLYCYGGTRYEWDPQDNRDPERAVNGDSKSPDRGLPEDPPVTKDGDHTGADVVDRRHQSSDSPRHCPGLRAVPGTGAASSTGAAPPDNPDDPQPCNSGASPELPKSNHAPCDLTEIPHVGPVTAAELHTAGIHTFQDLAAATDRQLLALNNVTTVTLQYIRTFLTERSNP
jgi:predicted flap endonuclease-1-like 5' DNA nuclease